MTKKTNQTLPVFNRLELHKSYGGRIYPSDFQTSYYGKSNEYGSPIASRIESDLRWEKGLRLRKGEC